MDADIAIPAPAASLLLVTSRSNPWGGTSIGAQGYTIPKKKAPATTLGDRDNLEDVEIPMPPSATEKRKQALLEAERLLDEAEDLEAKAREQRRKARRIHRSYW